MVINKHDQFHNLLKMKFFIIFVVLVSNFYKNALCRNVNQPTVNLTSKTLIDQLVDIFTNVAKSSDVEIPVPIQDSFEFDRLELKLPGEIFSINANISEGSLSGLSSVRLLELTISSTRPVIGFNVLFPSLTFHADHYELDGNIYYAVPLKGEGILHLEIYNLQMVGVLYMKESATSNSVLFDKLENAEFNIERIVSRTEFDKNIDNIISAMVEDLLANYLNRFNKYIAATYSDALIQFINAIIEEIDTNQL